MVIVYGVSVVFWVGVGRGFYLDVGVWGLGGREVGVGRGSGDVEGR